MELMEAVLLQLSNDGTQSDEALACSVQVYFKKYHYY